MRLSFGTCVLDTGQRLLTRDGDVVHLPPKALRLLEVLLQSRPRVVGRDELHDALWPRTFVARTNLPSLVAELRTAIGDEQPKARLIRTVHGFGYAFAGDVTELAPVAPPAAALDVSCRLILVEREIELPQGETLLGRTSDAAVWLDDENVSRRHARIVITGRRAMLEDLGSKNGTYVGSRRIQAPTTLDDGDVIWVGPFSMTFRAFGGSHTTRTAASHAASPARASEHRRNRRPTSTTGR